MTPFTQKCFPTAHLPEGVIIDSLCHVATEKPNFIAKYYAKLANTQEDGITALNTMLAQDGLLVYVPKNVKTDRPISGHQHASC